ncbi:MAG: SPOR domain-containing protein [Paracoccaceae bacterium]
MFQKKETETGEATVAEASTETTLIERDVEAPEVFQQTDTGLWDGRPSLGGVWVAHSDVTDPERVIIRNQANGKFVIGALFRRERDNPGPRFQVSSDAAETLGMLAGAPAELNVTALRREEVPIAPAAAEPESIGTEEIEAAPLDPVAAVAASAIEKAEGKETPQAGPQMSEAAILGAETATASVAPAPAQKSSLQKPYIQLGIFSVEANANKTADMLRKDGILPVVKKSSLNGKAYWRVLAGPATTATDRSAMLAKIKALGFADAYAVTN